MGSTRTLEPFPVTVSVWSSRSISAVFRSETSDSLAPVSMKTPNDRSVTTGHEALALADLQQCSKFSVGQHGGWVLGDGGRAHALHWVRRDLAFVDQPAEQLLYRTEPNADRGGLEPGVQVFDKRFDVFARPSLPLVVIRCASGSASSGVSVSPASAPGGSRTPNLLIRSQMLYPLSYRRSGPAYRWGPALHEPPRGRGAGRPALDLVQAGCDRMKNSVPCSVGFASSTASSSVDASSCATTTRMPWAWASASAGAGSLIASSVIPP